jgi:hypothetical protein
MKHSYRLSKDDLFEELEKWDSALRSKVLLVACGGTALTLHGYKETTRDVDFLIPNLKQYAQIISMIKKLGYEQRTASGWLSPNKLWLFDLFRGQTVFQTGLLDPIQKKGNHRFILSYKKITLGTLTAGDLVISKMFRGTTVDVDDSVLMIVSENLDLQQLAQRYKDTADYYYNPASCKTNLGYLIRELMDQGLDATPLQEMSDKWTP